MAMPNYDPQVSNNLFRDYQAGNDQALSELYQLWQGYIKSRVIRSKIPPHETDDLVHDVWIRVIENAAKWNLDRSGWFLFLDYRIKKAVSEFYRVLNTFKRQAVVNTQSLDGNVDDDDYYAAPLASDDPPVLNLIIFQERVQLVKDAILQCGFTDPVSTILAMRLDDQDYAVIAKAVDLPKTEVRKLLSTAIKTIRQRLETVLTD